MVLARDGRVVKQVTGRVRGRILDAGQGASGFGYDPLFFYRRLRRSFGELEPPVKNAISHRGRALAKLARFLPDLLEK
jgi:XTP/dITP diphosphohydrolase